jgi:diacylglycerol O-acyltransferase
MLAWRDRIPLTACTAPAQDAHVQTKKRLSPLDLGFLAAETRESMMHVGALMHLTPPATAREDFLYDLMEEIKRETHACPPWNLKLRFPQVLANPFQAWVEDARFDVEYHVRRSALPTPGGERELGILVSRLHSNSIDFHRPPWEIHFIEGLPEGRLAIYFKVHHSLIDGYTGMKLLARSFSTEASEVDTPMFFLREGPARGPRSDAPPPTLDSLLELARAELSSTRAAFRAVASVVRAARDHDPDLIAPLEAPRSVINAPIGRNRRFATQHFETDRLRRLGRSLGGTMNDVVLAACATSLRRLLTDLDALPAKPLTAMLPVNIRPKDDPGGGNAVGAVLASLATHVADPLERFHAIVASTKRAKEQLHGLTQNAILQYSAMMLAPMLLSQPPGAAGRVPPAFNVVISNVPGPREKLYFRGYRLDGYYPLSIPFHGYGLNITVVTYAHALNFGFTGDRDALPHMQRLAVYAREAIEELEAVVPKD